MQSQEYSPSITWSGKENIHIYIQIYLYLLNYTWSEMGGVNCQLWESFLRGRTRTPAKLYEEEKEEGVVSGN